MSKPRLIINNSFCELVNFPKNIDALVSKILSYTVDLSYEKSRIFYQIKLAKAKGQNKKVGFHVKQLKELESQEFVEWYRDNKFPTGHLGLIKKVIALYYRRTKQKDAYIIEDRREIPRNTELFRMSNKLPELRYYQQEMVDLGIEAGRGVFSASVGSGKTLVFMSLLKKISVNSLIIVPSRPLLEQFYQELENYFGSKYVEKIDTKKVRSNKVLKPIKITTIQTLAALQKSKEIKTLLEPVEALFLDEFHHAGSASYTNLLDDVDHIYWRWGCSGTVCRTDHKTLDMHGVLSNILYEYPASKAIAEGYLTPVAAKVLKLEGKRSNNYQKEYDKNYCGNPELTEAIKYILKNETEDRQILILVKRKDKSGKILHEFLKMYGLTNTYISGDDKKDIINNAIADFNDKKIRILIGSTVIGEGIDIRSTDILILAMGGKSEIAVTQAIGRCVRKYPGKDLAKVYDFDFSGTKFLHKHLLERKRILVNNFGAEIEG